MQRKCARCQHVATKVRCKSMAKKLDLHFGAGFQADAAAVERDALAHQQQRLRVFETWRTVLQSDNARRIQ